MWANVNARAPTRPCVRVPATLFIRLVRTSTYAHVQVSGACARVCLHTTFPMYTGIWVSVFLESGFSSLDFGVPASIFLDFLQNLSLFFHFFFSPRCQGQPSVIATRLFRLSKPADFSTLHPPTHSPPSPLSFPVFFFRLSHYLLPSSLSLSLSLCFILLPLFAFDCLFAFWANRFV